MLTSNSVTLPVFVRVYLKGPTQVCRQDIQSCLHRHLHLTIKQTKLKSLYASKKKLTFTLHKQHLGLT